MIYRCFISAGILLMVILGDNILKNHILLSYTDSSCRVKPVKIVTEWQIKRRQILDSMEAVMGPLPRRSNLPPMNIKFVDSLRGNGYTRYSICFTVARGENLTAYLYVPFSASKSHKCPAMIALHETDPIGKRSVDGQGWNKNYAYGKELAERGYVVIAPDYPGFGGLRAYNFKNSRYKSGTMKSIFDDMRCEDLLQARPDVDPEQIGVIGHLLGGHSAILDDADFNVAGVRIGIARASKVYQFLHAVNDLQVRYPESKHDFPPEVRLDAYRLIDKVLHHIPTTHFEIRGGQLVNL